MEIIIPISAGNNGPEKLWGKRGVASCVHVGWVGFFTWPGDQLKSFEGKPKMEIIIPITAQII
jgi:hypothetical protein